MNRPARYLIFVSRIVVYFFMLIAGSALIESIARHHLSLAKVTLYILGILCAVFVAVVCGECSYYDFKAILAKRPMPVLRPYFTCHGLSLYTVAEAIRHEKVEFMAAFSETGRKLIEITNFDETRVRPGFMDPQFSLSPGAIMVHNHPGGAAAFSPNDVQFLMFYKCSRGIVVTETRTYEVDFPREYSTSEATQAKKRLRRLMKQYKNDKEHVIANETLAKEFGYSFCQYEAIPPA